MASRSLRSGAAALRSRARRLRWPRLATASARRLPDFLIIGTQKGGTTSLFRYLSQHPQIAAPLRKEPHFFDLTNGTDARWYRSWFPLRHIPRGTLTFEASPTYLFVPEAPHRVHDLLPNAKFIVLLREPVSRAYSHYRMMEDQGREPLDFEKALCAEEARLEGARPPVVEASDLPRRQLEALDEPFFGYSYAARGRYVEQLRRWFAVFPESQFLVLRSEDLFEDSASTYRRVLEFVGLDPAHSPAFRTYNRGESAPIDPAVAERLRNEMTEANQGLPELVGIDPETWTAVTPWEELVTA